MSIVVHDDTHMLYMFHVLHSFLPLPRLDTEVNKWEDSRNDIVLLAKEMCVMMMDMSEFTRCLRYTFF